ncbi:PAP2 superfamily protein [Amycolatopsis xylanica]|uniref:PAP2 superfamily protein n=1 Tax=Amycolatopsis xylanica TaxID=589385 RepID=A0A1H3J3T0_9PSEU|nr:phosphatase PAP2 family protein [Amycolatopsis xylanica]SDY34179.1 PAP2 superfamily protein [Amycolatopsis xylanica]
MNRNVLVAGLCLVAMIALGVTFAGDSGPSAFDTAIRGVIDRGLGGDEPLLRLLVVSTQPYVLIPLLVLAALLCFAEKRPRDGVFVVVTTPVAITLNTWVLKPAFGRHYDDWLAYPSGHTVSLVATLTVLVVIARPGVARGLTAALSVVLVVAAGIGLIGLDYHYATDVLGGVLFASALALLSAQVCRRRAPAPSTGSPRADISSGSHRSPSRP